MQSLIHGRCRFSYLIGQHSDFGRLSVTFTNSNQTKSKRTDGKADKQTGQRERRTALTWHPFLFFFFSPYPKRLVRVWLRAHLLIPTNLESPQPASQLKLTLQPFAGVTGCHAKREPSGSLLSLCIAKMIYSIAFMNLVQKWRPTWASIGFTAKPAVCLCSLYFTVSFKAPSAGYN